MIENELRLEELLREEYRTFIALTWSEADESRRTLIGQLERVKRRIHNLKDGLHIRKSHMMRVSIDGLPSKYSRHIRTEIAAPFESLIIPASYEEFFGNFAKMAYNCIYCRNLDRNPRRLGRMNYKCRESGKSCFDVLPSSDRLCTRFSGIEISIDPPERAIFYPQLERAKEIFGDIKKAEEERAKCQ